MRTWPIRLAATLPDGGGLGLRELRRGDKGDLLSLRARNAAWLKPWEPTNPDGLALTMTFEQLRRRQAASIREGTLLPWVVTVDGAFAGQLNLMNIERRAFRSCTVGYWVGEEFAGRGVTPLALAIAGDFALGEFGLHRLDVNIRPENHNSLAVVAKLGLREEGLKRRYLHIDGAWRDHRSFAVTTEEIGPGGLVARLQRRSLT